MKSLAIAVFVSDMLGRLRRWLTFRRVLGIVVFLVLLLCLRQLIGIGIGADLSFIFGLDLGLTTEISALLIIIAVREQVATAAYVVRRVLSRVKSVGFLLRRAVGRSFRSRPAQPLLPPPPDDDPAEWGYALAH